MIFCQFFYRTKAPQEPQEFPCKSATTSTKDLFQNEDQKKEFCTCGHGETSTKFAKEVAIVEPVQRLPDATN